MEKDLIRNYIPRLRRAMQMQNRSEAEILLCTDYAEQLLSGGLPVLFDDLHVIQTLQLQKIQQNEYHTFFLHQKGKIREITAPSLMLKRRQRWILDHILSRLRVSTYAHGFVKNRSIKTNAMLHAWHSYALCVDIEDFFPSITYSAVARVFADAGYSRRAATALANVCCYQEVLPQGAPTSPYLANLVFYQLDEQLALLAREHGAIYSRYADDLTFSSDSPMNGLEKGVCEILWQGGFQLNSEKTKLYLPGQPKRITGLVVQNGTVRVPRYLKRVLKQEIYYCKKYGVVLHLQNRGAERRVNYREYLYGKAYYIQMIEPELGIKYLQELDEIEWPSCFL